MSKTGHQLASGLGWFSLTLVSRSWNRRNCQPGRLLLTTSSLFGVLATDLYAAIELSTDSQSQKERPTSRRASITVCRPRDEVYRRWKEFAQQPHGASRFGAVRILDAEPERLIRFQAAPDAEAQAVGMARFVEAIGGRGTEIHIELEDNTAGGAIGTAVEKLKGDKPLQLAKDDLRRFRQLLEVGEVVRSDGTAEGHAAGAHLHQRAAQPLEHANV